MALLTARYAAAAKEALTLLGIAAVEREHGETARVGLGEILLNSRELGHQRLVRLRAHRLGHVETQRGFQRTGLPRVELLLERRHRALVLDRAEHRDRLLTVGEHG